MKVRPIHEDVMRIGKGWFIAAAVLSSVLILRDSAAAQSSYYKIGGYCNGSDPCGFGDPIDLATGAFHIEERLAMIPGRVPVVLDWQFVSQDLSDGPLGQGTSLSTDYFITPAFYSPDYFIPANGTFELLGPKNVHFLFVPDPLGGGTVLTNTTDPPMLGSTLRFNVPRPSADLSGTLRFKSGDKFFFDATGALVRIEDPHGNFVTITRNARGYPVQVRQPSGRGMTFAYNSAGKLASVTLPLDRVWRFDYDPQGHLARVTDPAGAGTDYTWNADPIPDAPGFFPSTVRSVRDRRAIVRVTNDYEAFDFSVSDQRLLRQTYADGGVLTASYSNASGPGSDGSTVVTDPRGNVSTKDYTWAGGFGYDVTRAADAAGGITSFERRRIDRLVTGIVDFRGRRTDPIWDANGNMLSVARPTAAGGTATWAATYDATWNKPISITDELSRTTTFTLDAISGDVIGVTDPGGYTTAFGYAANGDLVSTTTPAPLSQTTTFRYTADGDLERITDPLCRTTEFTYDAASRRIAIRDANSKIVRFAYDALDRVTSVTQQLGSTPVVTTYQYDAEGNLQRLTNPSGNAWQWIYDGMNRVIEAKNPLLQSSFYTWDLNGNLLGWTDPKGQKGDYTYDAFNRRTSATFRRADGSVESTLALTYNPATRLLEKMADSQFGSYSFAYDGIDRIIGENGPAGSLSFTLDVLGRRTGLQVSGQPAITYGYDASGNLTSINQGASAYSFSYDPLNRLTERRLPNGVSTVWSLDAVGLVSSILSQRGGATVDSHIYTRDPVGQILSEDANGEVRSSSYDDLYRLTSASAGTAARSWTYDLAGNRLSETVAGATTTFAYDADNRLTTAGAVPVTHDANGNLVSDGTRTYTWDVRGRLAGVSAPGSASQFTYDPFDLRAGKAVNGVATSYLLDGQDVVSEISGGTGIQTLHGPMVDQPLSRAGLYFTPDHLGSTTTLTDGNGIVVQQYRYSPFGETSRSTAVDNPFQFTGRENDEAGSYYYRARHYSPKWGRFLSQDPIAFAGGDSNLYAYVGNDPVNANDAEGLKGKILDLVKKKPKTPPKKTAPAPQQPQEPAPSTCPPQRPIKPDPTPVDPWPPDKRPVDRRPAGARNSSPEELNGLFKF